MGIDLGLEVPQPKEEKETEEKKEEVTTEKSNDIAKQLIEGAEKREYQNFMCCLIIGQDDTGKTGIVLDYCSKLPKKTLLLDIDLGAYEVKTMYHKENKKILIPDKVLIMKERGNAIVADYDETMTNLNSLVMHVKNNHSEYSAIIVDGISTLLKYAEYMMRLDKHIALDGGVSLRYWIQRNKRFLEFLEAIKTIPGIDKFFIGHEDFIATEGKDLASVKIKTNQMIHQRIVCKKIKERDENQKETGSILFKAMIDKSKYCLEKQGKIYVFATVPKEGKPTWDVKGIFEGLK